MEFALFAALPVVVTLVAAWTFKSIGAFAGDFHKEFWPAGLRILHGESPYLMGPPQIADGRAFPYPAVSGLLMVPFALLSRPAAEVSFTVLCLLALAATLRVLNVRDWRIYGLLLLWAPVVNAWQSANLTLLLALAIALMWRNRDRPAIAGLLAALAISLKPFVWPLGLWLLATRRYSAAAYALATGLLINALGFAVLGFDQVGRYLDDARRVSAFFYRSAYTPVALLLHLGTGQAVALAAGVTIALCAAVGCLAAGRRGDELSALSLAVGLGFLATPVLWMHYFALALVPLAIARPRLEAVWVLPIALFVVGSRSTAAWQIVVSLAVVWLILASASGRAQVRRAERPTRGHRALCARAAEW